MSSARALVSSGVLALCLAGGASAQDSRPAPTQTPPAQTPSASGPTVVVLPLRFAPEALARSGRDVVLARQELGGTALSGRLTGELVLSRRFRVLERERADALIRELNLGERGLADPKQLPRGKLLAARYLVAGDVRTFRVDVSQQEVPGVKGRVVRRVEIEVEVGLRVIDSKTSLLLAAESCRFELKRAIPGGGALPTALLREIQAELATQLRIAVVDAIFPIRVLRLAGEDFLLDRGRNQGMAKGDLLDVFTGKGERRRLGVLEVLEVGELETRARLREGRGVAGGDECRRRVRKAKPASTSQPVPEGW